MSWNGIDSNDIDSNDNEEQVLNASNSFVFQHVKVNVCRGFNVSNTFKMPLATVIIRKETFTSPLSLADLSCIQSF